MGFTPGAETQNQPEDSKMTETHPDEIASLMARRAGHEREAIDYAQREIARMAGWDEEAITPGAVYMLAWRIDHVRRFGVKAVAAWAQNDCYCPVEPRGQYRGHCIGCGGPVSGRPEVEW